MDVIVILPFMLLICHIPCCHCGDTEQGIAYIIPIVIALDLDSALCCMQFSQIISLLFFIHYLGDEGNGNGWPEANQPTGDVFDNSV